MSHLLVFAIDNANFLDARPSSKRDMFKRKLRPVRECFSSRNRNSSVEHRVNMIAEPRDICERREEKEKKRSTHNYPKLNDSLYWLSSRREESGGTSSKTELDIDVVLFHGLQAIGDEDAFWNTWTMNVGSGENRCWPDVWLQEDLPGVRSLSVCYDSCLKEVKEKKKMNLTALVEHLSKKLVSDSSGLGKCPIVLVGHGLGGYLIREMLLMMEQIAGRWDEERPDMQARFQNFLSKVKGIFSYATLFPVMKSNAKRLPGTMNVFGAETAAFSTRHEFKAFRRRWNIKMFEMQMAEKPSRNNTKLSVKDSRRLITPSPDKTDSFQIASTDDLSEVCRPLTKEDNRYSALKSFLLALDLKVR